MFDPSQLEAVGRPIDLNYMASEEEKQSGNYKPLLQQTYKAPDGSQYYGIVDAAGGKPVAFTSPQHDKKYTAYFQNPESGEWVSEERKNKGWNPVKDVLEDKKLMTFIAIAAGGAVAGAYTGGATTGLSAGTGATAGTAGATTSATGAGGLIGGGASSGLTAAELAAINGAGVVESGSIAAGGYTMPAGGITAAQAGGAAIPAGGGGAGGGAGGGGSNFLDKNSFWGKIFGSNVGNQAIAGAITGIGQSLIADSAADKAQEDRQAERDWRSEEAEKERQHRSRNFQPGMAPKVDWSTWTTVRPEIQIPQIGTTKLAKPVDNSVLRTKGGLIGR